MIRKIVTAIVVAFHKFTLRKELQSAIDIAKEKRYKTHKKHMVLYIHGKFQVYERTHLKELIFKGGTFKRGINIRHLERSAHFVTD